MDSTKIAVVKEPNGAYVQAYSTIDMAKQAFKVSCSKMPYPVIFEDHSEDEVMVTCPDGKKFRIETEWLYHYPEHLWFW